MRRPNEQAEYGRVADVMTWAHAVFVFGSNESGKHGAGAARSALRYGAEWGVGRGKCGRTYAIPTKDKALRVLPLSRITEYVREFITFARSNPSLAFAVTRVGCGLAGYTDADIAPLFADAPDNCDLPDGWRSHPSPLPDR